MRGCLRVLVAVAAALALFAGASGAQDPEPQASGAEVVRGTVADSSGAPIEGAGVVVTGLQSLTKRTTHTDRQGRFRVLFGDAEGEYIVVARAIGYEPQGVRVRHAAGSSSAFLVANIVLSRAVIVLDTVAVRSGRVAHDERGVGAAQADVTAGRLFSLDPTDLDALAARAPGVARLGEQARAVGGFSMLGASPDQNRITVDGSTVVSPQLPPDAIAKATLAQTTYDPSQGGFAGGQLSVTTRGGNDYPELHLRTDYSDPHLAWADPAAPSPLARSATYSGGASGPLRPGRAYFNVAAAGSATTSPALSLLTLRKAQRDQYGLSADSIAELAGLLGTLGLPARPSAIPLATTGSSTALFTRVDVLPTDLASLHLTATVGDQRQLGGGVGPLAFPALAAGSGSRGARLQLAGSALVYGLLNDLQLGVQTQSSWSHPLLALPHGEVRLGTAFADGQTGITQVSFGGSSSGSSDSRVRALDAADAFTWTSPSGRHRVHVGGSAELGRSFSNAVQDPFGTYSYQSTGDLAANRPASYTRTISARALDSRTTSSALFAGGTSAMYDDALQLEYGMRVDFSHGGTRPPYNPLADSAFGVRTDRVPNAVGATPRLGFRWRMHSRELGPPVTLSGGVGGFRGVIPLSRIAGLTSQTGLPDAARQLTCAGAATPIPAWDAFAANSASVPTECADGSAATAFGSSAPAVAIFDPSYQPPTAWRGNLALDGVLVHGWALGLTGVYSRTLHDESQVDLNLRRVPAFTLGGEGDRPVYVTPDAIVPTTGAIAQAGSRGDARFAGVTSFRSDLRTIAGRLDLSLVPPTPLLDVFALSLHYSYDYGRMERRAFDASGTTSGDPFAREWTESPQPVHQFQIGGPLVLRRFTHASLSIDTRLSSGQRYTPIVGGDVNGDGRLDDRAFVFDPATTADTSLARQMSQLLRGATRSTRACLLKQLGRLAGANSCSTGWRLQPGVGLDLSLPWQNMGRDALDDHVHLSIATTNAIGGLLRLVHLDRSALGSLTSASYPTDPVLAYVTGFDPATRSYAYRLNQQFGEGRSQRIRSARYAGAFQVTIGGELHFGGAPTVPMVQQLGLVPADRNAPLPTREEMLERLQRQLASPYAMVLRLRDSLLLNDAQITALTRLDEAMKRSADSVLDPIADYVAHRGWKVSDHEMEKRMGQATEKILPLLASSPEEIAALLTDQQIERLPAYLKAAVLERRRRSKR